MLFTENEHSTIGNNIRIMITLVFAVYFNQIHRLKSMIKYELIFAQNRILVVLTEYSKQI